MGASIQEWAEKDLRYMKVIIFLLGRIQVVPRCCLKYIIFCDDLYCDAKNLNTKCELVIFKT